ncbi:ALDH22A1 [Symbiodinium necroappetens]|uniref:ALDH22A1 protein n=1 Tax=Symbiodinium necroappetens TaxID=1628268 RepID=A0A812TT56_9DINO|nr:ALDH22A1 [Symbiodinium necroappetens]|mmetsp:Transcript_79811/g.191495  ORF Transcript_79811/g.191495 Transcript_79811/m.191495 type:complete len:620 (+) Transcript_79811:69-1928(+)
MGVLVWIAEALEASGIGALLLAFCIFGLWSFREFLKDLLGGFGFAAKVSVSCTEAETSRGDRKIQRKFDFEKEWPQWPEESIPCWDPATLEFLGEVPACSASDMKERVLKARKAQQLWKSSSFARRRYLLRTIQQFVLENMDTICTVACRDSGKTVLDAMVGELTVTLEKLRWTIAKGETALRPEYRDSGLMNLHKTSRVEWEPVGVVGAIVPWNYPFHNVFNPMIAALFSGNAIVIKVSEFAAWSSVYLAKALRQCLEAAGAPVDLVQLCAGYGQAGKALVEECDKLIFVGSVQVGRKVMECASRAEQITPVILELGGKDPFVVCEDAQVDEAMTQLVVRGAFQNMGQNCAGPERFIVYEQVYDLFCQKVTDLVKQLKQGPPLGSEGSFVDCGACVHPPSLLNYQRLVDDAVSKGARVLCGGKKNTAFDAQFFEPTVLSDVTEGMLIAQEETFGPILSIFKVKGETAELADGEALRLANACRFALSACAHSASETRAAGLCRSFESGMASVNDVEGTTYLSQSLPFGGYKDSGFGRFAGPEGLRGLCHERSLVQNRLAFLKPSIPPAIAYPAKGHGEAFCRGLNLLLYGSPMQRLQGLFQLAGASAASSKEAGGAKKD